MIDDGPDILVYIPEAAEPDAERIVVVDRPLPPRTPWFERKEAVWVVLGAAAVLIAVLLLALRPTVIDVSASPEGDGGLSTLGSDAPAWAALTIPVPESYRTHTANVHGSVDVLAVADFGPGAADIYVGSVTTADGPADAAGVQRSGVHDRVTDRSDHRRVSCRTRQVSLRSSGNR